MSRSYGKSSEAYAIGRGWHKSMRARERLIIHKILSSADFDDVIFPLKNEISDLWDGDYFSNSLVFKKEIRDRYFLEIRNILNGFCHKNYDENFFEQFIEAYHTIKDSDHNNGIESNFEWLNIKAVKKAVKNWKGEPLDILKYLTQKGLIEKAVRVNIKISVSK